MSLYTTIKNTPWVWWAATKARTLPGFYWLWKCWFRDSTTHWQRHYQRGGDSGPGSYGDSALYKADLINRIILERGINSVIELGCGDGNQLAHLDVDRYIGLDISKAAIQRCLIRHRNNPKRSFFWYDPDYFHDPLGVISADCAISLDVIFHLVEDKVFASYVRVLFNCARRFVIIYAVDEDELSPVHVSVRLRKYSHYIAAKQPDFRVALHVPRKNKYGDLYLYERISEPGQPA